MKNTSRFKNWELALLGASVLTLTSSLVVYTSGISLRKHLLGWEDEESGVKVGKIGTITGKVRRELRNNSEFQPVETGGILYNYDTVMTGEAAHTNITLDGGGSIDLAANSMIRLTFDLRLSLGGVARTALVEVVAGTVSGKTPSRDIVLKMPEKIIIISKDKTEETKIIPIPVKIVPLESEKKTPTKADNKPELVMLEPVSGETIKLSKESSLTKIEQKLAWNVTPPETSLRAVLRKGKKVLLEKTVAPEGGLGSVKILLDAPGEYEWELTRADGTPFDGQPHISKFTISPDVDGIKLLPTVIAGLDSGSPQFAGKTIEDFKITLSWEPYGKIQNYELEILDKNRQTLLQKSVIGSVFSFSKKKLYTEQIFYSVTVETANGFMIHSPIGSYTFDFESPLLTNPLDQSTVKEKISGQGILLTWAKTNFTERYQIEVASDANFQNIIKNQTSAANFLLLTGIRPGRYWWRVRSLCGGAKSIPGTPFKFTVSR